MTVISMGLDVSGAKFGMVVLHEGDDDPVAVYTYIYKVREVVNATMDRADTLLADLLTELDEHMPDVAVIEGYGFTPKMGKNTIVSLCRLGELFRWALWKRDVPVIEVPPASLKKIVTGNGNADKDQMIAGVKDFWKYEADNDDEADAYALAQVGLIMRGAASWKPTTEARAVLGTIRRN